MQTQKSWSQHLISSKALYQSRLSFIIVQPHQVKAEVTPEQLVLYKLSDCIFMKSFTKLSSSFIMSSPGSHWYRFLTVDKNTVRAATNSHLQFSHTQKQAGLALQAADMRCDWILWLTELCHWHPQNQGLWLKRAGFIVAQYLDFPIMEEKKERLMYEIQFTQDEIQLHWLSSLNMKFTCQ